MATIIKKCRVCGKDYEACRSVTPQVGVFRWQSVACSPECGAEYLRLLRISRGQLVEPEQKELKPEIKVEEEPKSVEEPTPETLKPAPKRTRKKKTDAEE